MTEPTDADRAKAAEIVTPNFQPKWHGDFLRKAIAAALAAERAAAVAPKRAAEVWLRIREAHDWQCDCTPGDPCRVRTALMDTRRVRAHVADALATGGPA